MSPLVFFRSPQFSPKRWHHRSETASTEDQRYSNVYSSSQFTWHEQYTWCHSACLCLSDCVIKSVLNPRHLMKMSDTFGAWMMDTAAQDDERIWVAEHFSGTEERERRMTPHCCLKELTNLSHPLLQVVSWRSTTASQRSRTAPFNPLMSRRFSKDVVTLYTTHPYSTTSLGHPISQSKLPGSCFFRPPTLTQNTKFFKNPYPYEFIIKYI